MRARVRRWVWGGLVGAAAIAAAFTYLQTGHGFSTVAVPLLDAFVDGTLRAERGRVSLRGRVEASGVSLRRPGVVLTAETIRLELAPRSLPGVLLGTRRLRLEDLLVLGADVDVESAAPDGSESVAAGERARSLLRRLAETPTPPVAVRRARIEGRAQRRSPDGRVQERWSDVRLSLEDLVPRGEPRLAVAADLQLDPERPEVGYTGTLAAEVEAAAGDAGELRDLHATGSWDVVAAAEPDATPVRFSIDLERRAAGPAEARTELSLGAVRGSDELGRVRFELRAPPRRPGSAAAGETPATDRLLLRAELDSLTHEFCNPLLAGRVSGRLADGRIDGAADGEWSLDDGALRGRWQLSARDLRLRGGDEETPPLAFRVEGEGSWDPAAGVLDLERGTARLDGAGRRIADVELLRPIRLTAARLGAGPGADAEPGPSPDDDGQTAAPNLELRVADLDLDVARVALAALDVPMRPLPPGLTLDGRVRAVVPASGSRLALDAAGSLREPGSDPREPRRPRSLSVSLAGSVDLSGRLRLDSLSAELAGPGGPLAALRARGTSDAAAGSLRFEGSLAARDLRHGLWGLALLPEPLAPRLRGGRLEASGVLAREGRDAALRLAADLRLDGVEMRPAAVEDARRAWRVNLTGSAQLALAEETLRVESLELRRQGPDRGVTATLGVRGAIPLAWLAGRAPATPARLHLSADERDLRPWLELAGLDTAFAGGPVQLRARWDVESERPDAALRFEGTDTLALRAGEPPARHASYELEVRHRVERSPDGTSTFEADARLARAGASAGSARLRGSFRPASGALPSRLDLDATIPSLHLDATSPSLHLDPTSAAAEGLDLRVEGADLRALLELPRAGRGRLEGRLAARRVEIGGVGPEATEQPTPLAKRPALDAALPFGRAPALDAKIALALEQLALGARVLDGVEGGAELAEGRARLALERGRLWGGRVTALAAADWHASPPSLALRGTLEQAAMAPLFESEEAQGRADAAIELAGRGDTPRALLRTAAGSAHLSLGHLEFSNLPLALLGKDLFQIVYSGLQPGHAETLHCAVVRSRVEDGLGRVGVVIDTPTTTLAGGGAIDLRALEADVVLKPRSKRPTVGALRTPIRIAGPLGDLRAGLDPMGLATESAKLVALGLVNPFLVVVPLVDLGTGDARPCESALESVAVEPPEEPSLLERSRKLLEQTGRPLWEELVPATGADAPER